MPPCPTRFSHLPTANFSRQRTTKKFNVRRWCLNRTYEYYLPVTTLGLASPDGRAPGDAERLALFRAALQQYVGNRPFHNFAGDRKQYVKGDKGSKAAREEWAAQEAERRRAREAAAGAAAEEQAEADAEQGPTAAAGAAVGQEPSAAGAAGATSGSEEDEEARGDEADVGGRRVWVQTLRWLEDPDPKDPVVMSHYRRILSFSADDPRPLVEGARLCSCVRGGGGGGRRGGRRAHTLPASCSHVLAALPARVPAAACCPPAGEAHCTGQRSALKLPAPCSRARAAPGGVPCLRLEVKGDSFMLNQIRYTGLFYHNQQTIELAL